MASKDEKFCLLQKKEIYEFLEGSGTSLVNFNGREYGMPYYTATQLDELCTNFGVKENIVGSRWCYVEALLNYAIENERCDELFQLLFDEKQFDNLQDIDDMDDVYRVYRQIVKEAIKHINHSIRMTRNELVCLNGHFMIIEKGKAPVIETPRLNVRSIPYVQGLRERCKDDFNSGNYDSVITKSRTTIEEILVQILEENITPVYECDCSKEHMADGLATLNKDVLKEMIEEDKKAELVCHFCNKKYEFSKEELEEILKEKTNKEGE